MLYNILKIEEGQTKPFVEIWVEFSLTQSQVENEENLHTGRTLARMAANKIAAAEDTLLFRGKAKAIGALSPLVQEMNADSLGEGLLGGDTGTDVLCSLQVAASTSQKPDDLVDKVAAGIAELMNEQHYGPYALFLPAKRYAYACTPLSGTIVTPWDRVTPLVTGGFHGTGCLPDDDGRYWSRSAESRPRSI